MSNGIFGAYDFGVQDERYLEWIAYVFDRPTTPKGWYFDLDPEPPEFEATPSEIVGLIGKTMVRSGVDLVEFSNAQVDDGLSYIFAEPAPGTLIILVTALFASTSKLLPFAQ